MENGNESHLNNLNIKRLKNNTITVINLLKQYFNTNF